MNSDHYISLIYKELKGIISPEEAKDLREWKKQSSENQTISEETRQVWIESEQYELPFELDHDADFAKMKSTITTSNTPSKVVIIRPRRLWLRAIAAAVIVLLGATFLFQNINTEVEWKTVAANSEIQELLLADGSKVWLNSGSTLSYPAEFSTTERPIKLNGEAFFKVSKDANRPFQVTTGRTTVTVLGTEFNVRDIANERTFEVAVQKGKVRVQKNNSNQKVILVKNEKAVYDERNNSLEKVSDENLNALAWKRKRLKFDNTSLKNVLKTITKQYNITINLKNQSLEKCLISGGYSIKTNAFILLEQITSNQKIEVIKLNETEYELVGGTCK